MIAALSHRLGISGRRCSRLGNDTHDHTFASTEAVAKDPSDQLTPFESGISLVLRYNGDIGERLAEGLRKAELPE